MSDRRQFVITNIDGRIVGVYMIGEQIYDALICEDDNETRIGDVYVGRVKNVVDNIRAAFVEFREGVMGFLPLSEGQRKIVKPEQELIVQVKKPAIGNKDAVLSTDLELVGRYAVVHSNGGSVLHKDKARTESDDRGDGTGEGVGCKSVSKPAVIVTDVNISRKIRDEETVSRLHRLTLKALGKHDSREPDSGEKTAINSEINSLMDTEHLSAATISVTVRTNASTAEETQVEAELNSLSREMEKILEFGSQRTCFSCLHQEPTELIRQINRYPADQLDRIITDVVEIYDELIDCHIPFEKYEDASYSLDARYAISSTLEKALERRVWLKSGANLIIDRTEAMTVIDVNTAKAIEGKRASETTFFKINREAATEIARQLRLRNLSGIILVDFIDMKEQVNVDALISHLRSCLKQDPVKTTYVDYTGLGLVEITRTRQNKSLNDALEFAAETN